MPAYSPKRAPTLERISARLRRVTIALVASGVVAARALGATVYWDTNGSTAGTGVTPTGTWDTANNNKVWSTNSAGTGSTARWTNGDIAVFSAGTNGTNAFTITASTVTAGGIVFEEGQPTITGGTITLSAGASITATANATIASTLAGTNWTKNGVGTLTLSGSNTYTGALTIASGTLELGAAGTGTNTPLGTTAGSTNVSSGASLDLNGFTLGTAEALSVNGIGAGSVGALTNSSATAATYSGLVTLTGAATIGGTGNITLSHANGLAGNFLLTKTGTGTLTINSSSGARTGGAKIDQGTLKLANTTALGATSQSITLNGGTLDLATNTSVGAYPVTVTANSTIASDRSTSGSGITHTLGALSINNSTLSVIAGANVSTNSAYGVTFGATTLTGNATLDVANNSSGTGTLTLGAVSESGGARSLTKTGAGTLVLSGSNSYTGKTSIQNGTLAVSTLNDVGSGASSLGAPTTVANGTIDLGSGTNSGTLRFTGTLFQSTNRVINLAGTTGGGVIDGSGTGGLAFTSNLTATGIGAKTLTLTGSNTANAFSGAIVNGSGTTSLTKDGAGTWTLNGANANTYSGTTTVNAGTLALAKTGGAVAIAGPLVIGDGTGTDTVQLNAANQIAATSAVTFTAGGTPTLNLNGHSQTLGSIASTNTNAQLQLGTPAGSSTLTVGDSTSTTFAGVISGGSNASFVKQGSGTLTLSGANTLSGPVSVTAGTLALSGASVSLGASAAGTTVSSGATLALQGGVNTSNGQLSLIGTGVTNTGALTNVSGTNTWTGNLTLAGNTTINSQSGTLNLGSARPPWDIDGHTQPPENGFVTIGGQTLTFTGSGNIVVNSRIRDFVGQTAGTSYLNATTLSYAPETTNPGNVVVNMSGTGAVTLKANANSYTGSTTVQAGTLILNTVSNVGAPHDGTTDSFHAINGPLVIGTGSNTTSATVQLGTGGAANELLSIGTTVSLYRDGLLNLMGNAQTIDALTFTGGTVDVGDGGALYLNNNVTVNASAGNTATITGTGSGMVSMTLNRDVIADTGPDATRTFTVHHGTGNTYDLTISALVKNGDLIKAGDGTMMLNRHNTYIGYTSVTGGILNIQAGSDSNAQSGLGSGDGLTDSQATFVNVNPTTNAATGTSATLQLQGNISLTSEKIYLAGNGYTPSDAAQGTSPLGALNNHSGNNIIGTAATELIKLAADTRINSSSGLLTVATNIGSTNNNALTVGGSGNTTISGSINTGEGSTTTVTKDGSGTLILSGLNSYQGATNVTAGVLSVQHNRGLGAVTTGSNGTFVTSGAELQLSNAANGNLSIGGEALTLNGAGIGGTSGALHNVAGNNSFGGLITLGSAATIKSDAGTTLTLSGGTTTVGNNYGLTIAGAGNTTISGGMTNSAGSLTKNDSGTFTFAGTSGSTTGTVGKTHLNAGNMKVGNGSTPTTLNTAEFDSAVGTTLTIASGGTVVANYASGTTYFSGAIASTGTYGSDAIATFQKDGAGTLVFDHSFNAGANSKLVLNGGTLSLLGASQITFGTIHITANTVLDFNNIAGTFLSSAQLVIDAGVTVTVNNWISVANNTAQSTVWYATNTVNAGTLGGSDILGGTPLGQITFTNYNGLTTTWVAGNHDGWFDHEIRPTPEPTTYGAIFLAACFGLLGWRRWRRK